MDIEAATQAYLNTIPAAVRAQSDAYTEGGYWLILWGLVVTAIVTGILVRWKILESVSLRLQVQRPRPVLTSLVVAAAFEVFSSLLEFPWTVYTDWWREHSYGLSRQPFGDWFGQSLIGLAVNTVVLSLMGMGLYALLRRSRKRWWFWGGGAMALVTLIMMLLSPVFIEPLFNANVRSAEREADNYSLDVAGEPDGMATALIKTVEYRKASPGPIEEFLFHSHPSVENRIRNAMRWKAEQGGR
jgi:STE24 endopeptidase